MAKDAGGGLPVGYRKQSPMSGGRSRGGGGGSSSSSSSKRNNGQHLGYNRAGPKGGTKGTNPSDYNQRSKNKK